MQDCVKTLEAFQVSTQKFSFVRKNWNYYFSGFDFITILIRLYLTGGLEHFCVVVFGCLLVPSVSTPLSPARTDSWLLIGLLASEVLINNWSDDRRAL